MKRLVIGLMWLLAAAAFAQQQLIVDAVVAGSAAERAGVQDGDRILRLGEQELGSFDQLRNALAAASPGDALPLVVERSGEKLELNLVLGKRPDGGASLGVSIAVHPDVDDSKPVTDDEVGTVQCLDWIEKTYRIEWMTRQLDLDLAEVYETARVCVVRDTRRMSHANAVKFCDNVFKAHCSGQDLLTEIGEAQVEQCEETIRNSLGVDPAEQKGWRTCGRSRVFEDYAVDGKPSDEAACRQTFLECGGMEDAAKRGSGRAAARERSAPARAHGKAAWPQWGGPAQDFHAPAGTLAAAWPEGGPRQLWSRPLGDGYSAIVAEGGRLYTMYRDGEDEVVVCLDAATGETVWEYRYPAEPVRLQPGFGIGPRSTPLIAGDRLFAVGIAGKLHALDRDDGSLVWSRKLWAGGFNGTIISHGYSSSPAAYKDLVIVPVGGEQAGLVAFEQKTGKVRWKTASFRNSYSSPRIVEVAGETQILVFVAEELLGVHPETGEVRWRYPHTNQWGHNITMPEVLDGDTLFLSSPQAGARGLRLSPDGDDIQVEEVWASRRVQFYHGSSVRDGDWVYGSTGMASPAFLTAVNIRTGEVGWKERGFAKANCVLADGKLILLDEDGVLALATATPKGFVVHSRVQLLDNVAWTVPTIVGKTLYVRDKGRILAADLG
jgi:outer membrane protein assembly factor BamB